MLTHISELLSADNASSLAYINGLPSPPDNAPHKPLDVLKELEKRGVFSHENVEPLIGLLTDLHRVDIINTCGVREYKNNAEQASKSSLVMEIKLILRERERERDLKMPAVSSNECCGHPYTTGNPGVLHQNVCYYSPVWVALLISMASLGTKQIAKDVFMINWSC